MGRLVDDMLGDIDRNRRSLRISGGKAEEEQRASRSVFQEKWALMNFGEYA